MARARRSRGKNRYDRPRATKSPLRVMRVYAEGKVTEPEYVSALAEHLGLPKDLVRPIKDSNTDARGLVDSAIRAREKNRRRARQGQEAAVDDWWVIVDTESNSESKANRARNIEEAKRHAGGAIKVICDSPSIEYWFLLHYRFTTRDFDSSGEVIKELAVHMPGYTKTAGKVDWTQLVARTEDGLANAERVHAYCESAAAKRPIVECDQLARAMMENAARR